MVMPGRQHRKSRELQKGFGGDRRAWPVSQRPWP